MQPPYFFTREEDLFRGKGPTGLDSFHEWHFYSLLMRDNEGQFPRKMVWNSWIPTKISFAWEAWWGKVLTMDQLKKRGRHLANRCPLCGKEEENLDHLLLFCIPVQYIWALLFTIFGVNWMLPGSVKDTLEGWQGSFARKKLKKLWMAAHVCQFWIIWKDRNKAFF